MKKERVDVLLVKQGIFDTREQAKRAVMAGQIVDQNNERKDKPGEKVVESTTFRLKNNVKTYASRGGFKLEKALDVFGITVKDKLVLDIGASTGGFTDVMLMRGARMSYALDVGYNQLAWRLRQDQRVVVMERMNFRHAVLDDFIEGQPDFASIDVSFISLQLILPNLKHILKPNGKVVALVKPQFEAGREKIGKKGIVRDANVHESVLRDTMTFAYKEGYSLLDIDYSPITGGDGNIEFLLHLKLQSDHPIVNITDDDIKKVVQDAHQQLR